MIPRVQEVKTTHPPDECSSLDFIAESLNKRYVT
jgi:hypothetical protein